MLKLSSISIAAFILLVSLPSHPASGEPYVDFGFGSRYTLRPSDDSQLRWVIQTEIGDEGFGFPVNLSFGDNLLILGLKPRAQTWFAPFQDAPVSVAMGVGPVINFSRFAANEGGFDINAKGIALGVQPSIQIKYQISSSIHLKAMPIAFDFMFWRYSKIKFAGQTLSRNNTSLDIVYQTMLSLSFTN
jgi:hypothetical protein